MKKVKSILALLLSMALLFGVMAGCGSSSDESSEAASSAAEEAEEVQSDEEEPEETEEISEEEAEAPAEEEPAEEEPAEEETPDEPEEEAAAPEEPSDDLTVSLPLTDTTVTLTYWTTVSPMFADVITSMDNLLVWNEMEARTNVHIEGTLINPQAGDEQFALMIASANYTDLMDSPGANYTTGLAGALDDEVLVDLSDIVENEMPNYNAIIQSNEEYRKGTRMDDGRIGMIYGLMNEDYEATEGPVIRQDWLDELGLDKPVTYDDLHDVLVAFKENYGAVMWLPYCGSPTNNYLGAGYGIATSYLTNMSGREPFFQIDGVVKFGPMEDAYYDYLEMLHEWYEEGLIWSDFVSYTEAFNAPPDSGIISGQFGVWFSSYQNFKVWTESADDPDFHIVAFTDPVMNEGDTNHLRAETYLVTSGGIGISTACENVEIAAHLIDYWFSEEGRFLITFGIEGETYELDSDGHPQYTDLIVNNPDGYSEAVASALYIGGFGFHSIDHEEYAYLETTDTPDQVEAPKIWMSTSDNAYGIPTIVTPTVDESTESAALLSDIGTYVSTWMLQVIIGDQELNEETFEEFRSTLESLNIQQAIDNKQAALDRYNSR